MFFEHRPLHLLLSSDHLIAVALFQLSPFLLTLSSTPYIPLSLDIFLTFMYCSRHFNPFHPHHTSIRFLFISLCLFDTGCFYGCYLIIASLILPLVVILTLFLKNLISPFISHFACISCLYYPCFPAYVNTGW